MYVAIALRPTAYFHPLNTWIPLFYYFLYGLVNCTLHVGTEKLSYFLWNLLTQIEQLQEPSGASLMGGVTQYMW